MAGLATVLGSGAMTNSIKDAVGADTIMILGSNTTEAHPVIGAKIKRNLREGGKLVVVDPRRTEIAELADVHLQIKPGTDVAVLNALLHVIVEEDLLDKEYIDQHTESFVAVKENVQAYTPEYVAEIAGVNADDIRAAARLYGAAETAAIFYTMGITQHTNGTDNVRAIANLAMATGNLGKPGTGINPLRGQNNVQGACDMGALPNVLPGYKPVQGNPGKTVGEMFTAANAGSIKAMYIVGENPALSDPDANHVKESLQNLDFLVVQDIFLTETAELADVVLPAVSFAEKNGTFTNTERRVQLVRKAISPVGGSRPDWQIVTEIARRLGADWQYQTAEQVFAEIGAVNSAYAGLNYERLSAGGISWPCLDSDHSGTPILHANGPARGKGQFSVVAHVGSKEQPDAEYPFILTTGRILYHYHTGTMTRNTSALSEHRPMELVEIHPQTAAKLNVEDGELVKISSRRGSVEAAVKVSQRVSENLVFMTFHFRESAANVLTNPAVDKTAKTPELKVAAVRIEKL